MSTCQLPLCLFWSHFSMYCIMTRTHTETTCDTIQGGPMFCLKWNYSVAVTLLIILSYIKLTPDIPPIRSSTMQALAVFPIIQIYRMYRNHYRYVELVVYIDIWDYANHYWVSILSLFLRLKTTTISKKTLVLSSQTMTWIYCLNWMLNLLLTMLNNPIYQITVLIIRLRLLVQLKEQFLHIRRKNLTIDTIVVNQVGSLRDISLITALNPG